jgi:agmatine deiminase
VSTFRQPAEWTPHAATWVAWPSAADLWLDNLADAQSSFTAMCAVLADPDPTTHAPRGERLQVLVPDEDRENEAKRALSGLGATFRRVPFGDIWLRDTAPVFLTSEDGKVLAARFGFNGWGKKFVLPHDDAVAARVAELAGHPTRAYSFVLEGGSVEVDGEGTVLTTRQCLENPNRNPGLDTAAITRALVGALGVEKVLWLGDGLINDHTDGHVDTIARFVRPGVVVCMEPRGPDDPNARVLSDIARDLSQMTDARGRRLEVVRIPSPGNVLSPDGDVMPASYVNFYIANTTVAVPTYGSPWDAEAVAAIAKLFPGRRTAGVDARVILLGGGAFHCITQQEPKGSPKA